MRLASSAVLVLSLLFPGDAAQLRWVCYYSDTAPTAAFDPFELLVLDSDSHPQLQPLSDRKKKLIGYLSVGEIENTRSHFSAAQADGILLEENKNWKGAFLIDVRDPRWTKQVVEHLIPEILGRGFTGVFLDTVDNAPYLEQTDPVHYKGMAAAMVRLIKAVRRQFPRIQIIMNRGFDILPDVAGDIDMVLGESMFTNYDLTAKKHRLAQPTEYRAQVELLKQVRQRNPRLTILTLDYWDPADRQGVARIYREQRANGFAPYVATIGLDRIVKEPKF
jgi:uncharacterized protein (TIGR01370 family)